MFVGSQGLAQLKLLEDDLQIMGVFGAVIKYMLSKQELLIKVPKKIFRKREKDSSHFSNITRNQPGL